MLDGACGLRDSSAGILDGYVSVYIHFSYEVVLLLWLLVGASDLVLLQARISLPDHALDLRKLACLLLNTHIAVLCPTLSSLST